MKLDELLEQYRTSFSNERDKGTAFEKLVVSYLKNEPKYKSIIKEIWEWKDFPYRENIGDTGIDLVALTYNNEFWAIQCKFYDETREISKSDVDTFLATSSKMFDVEDCLTKYSYRLIVSTTVKYSTNAEDALQNQDPPVGRIGIDDLRNSEIDWEKYSLNSNNVEVKAKKTPRPHQDVAISKVLEGLKNNDRGKLIMACGTGKTYTSLRIVEDYLNGKGNVLFLVPSIALASQTLTEWSAQCRYSFAAAVVCSDNKASKGEDAVDLGFPSTTNVERLKEWANNNSEKDLRFIFSTYQSIQVVSDFQKATDYNLNIIVCDEAHRTTGVTLSDEDESHFVKVHDNEFIKADKRLYMTATPRIYGDGAKSKADESNAVLCSMDDEKTYGPEFHRLGFGEAVKLGLLSDYKVLVLAVDEEYVKKELQDWFAQQSHELKLEDSVKIMGCWNGLSKISTWDEKENFLTDPNPMKRAVAFCSRIDDSKKLVQMFKDIQKHVKEDKYNPELNALVNIDIKHVDGTYNALEKKEHINWLKDDIDDGNCRILTNARCLSEGVDVPALDAVMFLNPRNSLVDVIQSVGRVMRKSEGKKYGYVILPIGISATESPDEALDKNEKYKLVWEILQALRAHDDRFNNTINKIELNKNKPDKIDIIGIGERTNEDSDTGYKKTKIKKDKRKLEGQIMLDFSTFDNWKDSIYAKMVKKVGSRIYWETWAKDVAEIASTHMDKMHKLITSDNIEIKNKIKEFVLDLRKNLNNSITESDAVEMLAEHMITKPIFDALFEDYEFVKYNPVSQTMQKMIDILDKEMSEDEKEKLIKFHESVKERAQGIDNAEGKQRIILELYEKFFKIALPNEVSKLGIVYTPNECVDFIIKSVETLMNKEFNKSISDHGVHIIDGFTGTGTFIVRLLQSGVIKPQDILYKYTNEIHANEIVLLAYYIAAINIEATFHELTGNKFYTPFEGIVLTDTFQLYEDSNMYETNIHIDELLNINNQRAQKQKDLPITICIGNPPYSVGQRSSDDNASNIKYKNLDEKIAQTYVKNTNTVLARNLYDSYIRAFRWATDRINKDGIIAFISNGSFIDSNAMSGFRKSLIDEFTSIYIFNLRGNQRTSGEVSRKEGGKIFGSGSRTPVSITCLVKNSNKDNDGFIHYYDIGDYLSREEKLNIIKNKIDISNLDWQKIYPDENNDWINLRNKKFDTYPSIAPETKNDSNTSSFFTNYAIGTVTSRDAWLYNFNSDKLENNVKKMLKYYNEERLDSNINNREVNVDTTKISWSRGLRNKAKRNLEIEYKDNSIIKTIYRPFIKENFYFDPDIIESPGKSSEFFVEDNKIICLSGIGGNKPFSCLMLDNIPCLDTIEKGQCFPLYTYSKILNPLTNKYEIRRENAISDNIKKKIDEKYQTNIIKEDIFYYVYGLLHSNEYKTTFESNLKKSLPTIPIVNDYNDFIKISEIGKKLSDLHLNFEKAQIYKKCDIIHKSNDYSVVKMKFGKNKDKTTIEYNNTCIIKNIPLKAYEYIVNGKSPIEWIMERYAITEDKSSGIINNPNDWCIEQNDEKYIFNLLLKVINVSVNTVNLINQIPKLNLE